MKVLRGGSHVRRQVTDDTCAAEDAASWRLCGHDAAKCHSGTPHKVERRDDCLSKKMDAVLCNGNGIVGREETE